MSDNELTAEDEAWAADWLQAFVSQPKFDVDDEGERMAGLLGPGTENRVDLQGVRRGEGHIEPAPTLLRMEQTVADFLATGQDGVLVITRDINDRIFYNLDHSTLAGIRFRAGHIKVVVVDDFTIIPQATGAAGAQPAGADVAPIAAGETGIDPANPAREEDADQG
jgi:hypothetical protein